MSEDPQFKLLSKKEIEKNRIKAYKYIDMSKEQTPIEIIKVMLENEVAITIDHVNNLLTKEKEQRDELIKEAIQMFISNPTVEDFMKHYRNRMK